MRRLIGLLVMTMFLWSARADEENPWVAKLPAAVAEARREGTAAAYLKALDAAWRADRWESGLELAEAANAKFPDEQRLRSSICRALWRAGRIIEAERIAERLSSLGDDRVALHMLILIHSSRGEFDQARKAGERLHGLDGLTAADLSYVMTAWSQEAADKDVLDVVRKIEKRTDPKNGYPETLLTEMVDGVSEFLERAGSVPMNTIEQYGSAAMPPMPMINLPGCKVMINGKGPYRLIVDTGGSTMLSLDSAVAEELGLERMAGRSVRGVGGTEEAWQTLVDELRIGELKCKRVMTVVFGVRAATAFTADGILGTGIFSDARMTLDFEHAALRVARSGDTAGRGKEFPLRIISDGKLMAPVTIHGRPATALLDSGADVVALSPTCLRRLFPDQKVRTFLVPIAGVGSGQNPTISFSRGVDLEFGGRMHENVSGLGLDVLDTILSPYLGIQSDVLIGMPTFRQMKSFTVDFPKRRMWIDWLVDEPVQSTEPEPRP